MPEGLVDIKIEQIPLKNGMEVGIKFELRNAPLLLISAIKGYVMCGYLNIQTANYLGDVAAKVTGVSTFDDVLGSKVVEVSKKAKGIGIAEGMTGREALEKMF